MFVKAGEGEVVFNQNLCQGIKKIVTGGIEIVTLVIEPGGTVPGHQLPFDVTFYVIAGQGRAGINGTIVEAHTGDIITVAAGDERMWSNAAAVNLELLVIKHIGTAL